MVMSIMSRMLSVEIVLSSISSMCVFSQDFADVQGIEFKLYRLELQEWHDKDHEIKLQNLIIPESNHYCSVLPNQCHLMYWNSTFSFQRTDILVIAAKMEGDSDLSVRFQVFSNFSSSLGQGRLLPKSATKEIFIAIKDDLEESVDSYVTYIDEDFYGIPINLEANRIIIPVAVAVLVLIIIVAIALTMWDKKKQKERQKDNFRKSIKRASTKVTSKQNGSASGPTHVNVKTDNGQTSENDLMKDNTDNREPKYMETKHISPVANDNDSQPLSDASYVNEVKPRHFDLPPLNAAEATSENKPSKHRKRKKSKRKHKDKESHDNSGMDESESETFNHTITNVQPNNVIEEESYDQSYMGPPNNVTVAEETTM